MNGGPTFREYLLAVCSAFDLNELVVRGRRRTKDAVQARAALVYLLKPDPGAGRPYTEIARMLKRDHSTIMAARRKADLLISTDRGFGKRLRAAELYAHGKRSYQEDPNGKADSEQAFRDIHAALERIRADIAKISKRVKDAANG